MPEISGEKNTTENDNVIDENESNHWLLIRKVMGFQLKLAMDGLRDVLLSPISIGAALLGLLTRPDDPGKYYRDLLKFGMKSDRWINLFDAPEHGNANLSSDEYIRKIEELVVSEYKKGGVLKSVKDHTDNLINKAQNSLEKKPTDSKRTSKSDSKNNPENDV